jgi:hypothetical protein
MSERDRADERARQGDRVLLHRDHEPEEPGELPGQPGGEREQPALEPAQTQKVPVRLRVDLGQAAKVELPEHRVVALLLAHHAPEAVAEDRLGPHGGVAEEPEEEAVGQVALQDHELLVDADPEELVVAEALRPVELAIEGGVVELGVRLVNEGPGGIHAAEADRAAAARRVVTLGPDLRGVEEVHGAPCPAEVAV